MLPCGEARDRIGPWIAGEIEAEARQELEVHLHACPACSAEAERTRRTLALLETLEVPDPGLPYWSSFGPRLRSRIAAAARRNRALRLAAVAAAAVLAVAGLALLQFRQGEIPPQVAAGGRPVSGTATPASGAVPQQTARPAEARPASRAPQVEEAEARLSAVLEQAAAEGRDLGDLEAILDEVAPPDPLDLADALGRLSPEEGRSLSEELLDMQG